MAAGLKTIITLSFVLAIGFLLVILSSALYQNYLPLLVVATYVIAPLPNFICQRCSNPDDFMESSGNAVVDFGRFCTGFLVVMGICRCSPKARYAHGVEPHHATNALQIYADISGALALPALLAHCALIRYSAMAMSIVGGLLIYGTIISFTMFFQEEQDF
ncbi:MAG: Vacuolar protein sorting-associated protein 55 [Candelina mexicana]|nr:MAG: Vacuolar protein sorting-associated protein 55 [Candelina mexicana]